MPLRMGPGIYNLLTVSRVNKKIRVNDFGLMFVANVGRITNLNKLLQEYLLYSSPFSPFFVAVSKIPNFSSARKTRY